MSGPSTARDSSGVARWGELRAAFTDEHVDALAAFREGRSALLDFDYGLEIVRLTMAAYLSAERGRVVDLTDAATRAELDDYIPLIQQGRGLETL